MNIPDILLLPPNRVWRTYLGGKIIDSIQDHPEPRDSHFPEDWIASATEATNHKTKHRKKEGLSEVTVDGNPVTLKDLMKKYPNEMVGHDHYRKFGANTQFLVKFLDASIRLHLQAHPTIPFAQKYLNSNSGKTEAYVILGTRNEIKLPYIYLGFQKPINSGILKEIVENQDIDRLLTYFEKIPVKPGDVFFVPGGLPHAIGEGVFMIEIMEPTDFVVRLEFERGGYILPEESRFMGRGIDFAMNMIDFQTRDTDQIKQHFFCRPQLIKTNSGGTEYGLIGENQTSCFSVHKLIIKDRFLKTSDSFYVGIVTKGNGQITTDGSQINVKEYDRFFIPYKTQQVEFISDNDMEIIVALPPKK